MKSRLGFVSNSSSSSFIIGIGVVKDVSTYAGPGETELITIGELRQRDKESRERYDACLKEKEAGAKRYCWLHDKNIVINRDKEYVRVTSFMGSEVSVNITGMPDETTLAMLSTSGELDGDYAFYGEDDEDNWMSEPDYDLSPTDMDYEMMGRFSEGLDQCETDGGAGRNG